MPASTHSQDESMPDAAPQSHEQEPQHQEQIEDEEDTIELDGQRITILPGAAETAASFQFDKEDHTLGNALRYVIMKNPEVEFCGYTMPHPSEAKMNLRIQTYDTTNVFEVLEKGFDDLMDLCDTVTETFMEAKNAFGEIQSQ
ncbi:RNA polymerase subunit AC19 [Blastomyces dermatitidis]|uniref:DNA-directed RNA polymerases I and III subunit RPAC2 n=3 Tax=Blastomyces TaxID=229219 RepID=A0A179UWB9_BLAGS|nr:DNA-directed RNA polymerase I and III subunit RPAC2 [Blastomyces gilchristii SLH14081]XP_045276914.1 DNA-directed RNA polymerase I and III subunit RPAC2 [Blastomyces dermatitidis ER-3]EGE83645.1 DNA-directed RNA polymerase I and III subunit RPAC2 [Blastomyces dermatitidis ATCC 18188]EQL34598.1 DNA-directed RNA polymerase I and III subunit RPAC2 [Blastomyces dermatitidis ATCC 26199]EEQ90131.1 DNA-directed RNA polymerase I and III subunit RPAC2 [Blastomyces dermatitidis ER-3]OAT12405.1 DNA-di